MPFQLLRHLDLVLGAGERAGAGDLVAAGERDGGRGGPDRVLPAPRRRLRATRRHQHHHRGGTTPPPATPGRSPAQSCRTAGELPVSGRRRPRCGRRRRTRPARRPAGRRRPSGSGPAASTASRSPGATSSTSSSCTCSSSRDRSPASRSPRSTPSIATLMMSAAEPWIGAFSAIRSAISPALPVVAGEVGQVAPAAEDRLGVAVLPGRGDHVAQVVADAAEALEVGLHLLARLVGVDPQLLGQPVRRQAVGQPVGHRLDPPAQLRVDRLGRQAERLGRDEGVQVLAGLERLDQPARPRTAWP